MKRYKLIVVKDDLVHDKLLKLLPHKQGPFEHLTEFYVSNNWQLIQARLILEETQDYTYGFFPVDMPWQAICGVGVGSPYFKPPEDLP